MIFISCYKATTVPSTKDFKAHALPLHLHVTHTPPAVAEAGTEEDPTPNLSTDPGHIASVTLTPSTFATGSYGWKGSKRVAVELKNADGKKEKVMVMMTVNATVVGSKPTASKGKKKSKAKDSEESDVAEESDDE